MTIEVDENDSSHPLSYWDDNIRCMDGGAGTYTVYLGDSVGALTTVGTFTAGS